MELPKLNDGDRQMFLQRYVKRNDAHIVESRRFSIEELCEFFAGHIPSVAADTVLVSSDEACRFLGCTRDNLGACRTINKVGVKLGHPSGRGRGGPIGWPVGYLRAVKFLMGKGLSIVIAGRVAKFARWSDRCLVIE